MCARLSQVVLSFDVLDMGDIFINSKHAYEVTLLNKGDIAADWALQAPQTPFARKFKFWPMQGTLDVKDRCTRVRGSQCTTCTVISGDPSCVSLWGRYCSWRIRSLLFFVVGIM